MWVTTSPWQSGEFICYDLNKVFKDVDFSKEISEKALIIEKDSLFLSNDYSKVVKYRNRVKEIKSAISNNEKIEADVINSFLNINPNNYYTYRLIGDYYMEVEKNKNKAREMYNICLLCAIPQLGEREYITKMANEND